MYLPGRGDPYRKVKRRTPQDLAHKEEQQNRKAQETVSAQAHAINFLLDVFLLHPFSMLGGRTRVSLTTLDSNPPQHRSLQVSGRVREPLHRMPRM
ncbi:hypothetical protein PoB_004778000 [Plakobranchus ocellatus]|uniref:Uncharacterized protein n=1 Tax=Plakobranchus ocellatus TaxID=259542 RepID=A0AAV4BP80_9GAST|nr:hypothetical protein PoB_004778000 [Plakobranchus ocellatus]